MPAQKRSYETSPTPDDDDSPQHDQTDQEEEDEVDDAKDDEDSVDGGSSSSSTSSAGGGDKDESEFVIVKLAEIRKEVQCPICLGIIRKTRTVMECLHRFCRECIDKSMRLGNNECPACRTHCASRRSLRDDPNYDALIAAIYPDIDKYEQEELAFHVEEKARNKQIQASIAQTLRRQSDALGKKKTARAAAAAFARRQGNHRNSRGRRSQRNAEAQGSDNEEDANGDSGGKDSSSSEGQSPEVKPKRQKRWGGSRVSHPSLAASSADGGGDENDSEVNKESMGASAGLVGISDMLAWGRGGMRSNMRNGNMSGGNAKNAKNNRLSKLIDCLRNSGESDELDIHLRLVSLDEQRVPSLQRPNLCCKPTLSIGHLCQYVALQTGMLVDELEMLLVKDVRSQCNPSASLAVSVAECGTIDPLRDELHVLEDHETLVGIQAMCNFSQSHLLLAYRQKSSVSVDS